jgi:trehalose 6-phosphate phosphatase
LHYRATPHSAESLIRAARPLSDRWPELRLLEGQCVLELVPARASKGTVLRQLMLHPPFAGRVPVMAGDDVTDEDAFVAALALGGFGIAVGPRPSAAARYRLADCAALNAWLRGLAYPTPENVDA